MTCVARTLAKLFVVFGICSGLLSGGQPRAAEPALCPLPPELLQSAPALGSMNAALRSGRTVTILAVGTASTTAGGNAYPRIMLNVLERAVPTASLQLVTVGGRGLSTVELLPILSREVSKVQPMLVLWQTGTVDAVESLRPDDMRDAIEEGARLVAAAGADLILIDPQYSRFLAENADLSPYEDVLEDEGASLSHVSLFPRFQLMQAWADSEQLDVEAAPQERRAETAAQVRACVGQALARYILAGLNRGAFEHEAE